MKSGDCGISEPNHGRRSARYSDTHTTAITRRTKRHNTGGGLLHYERCDNRRGVMRVKEVNKRENILEDGESNSFKI